MALTRLVKAAFGLSLAVGVARCQAPRLPGERVGVYRVIGTLEENSCGSTGLAAPDPLSFKVEIRDEQGVGVWAVQEKPFIQGSIKNNGDFLFRLEDRFSIRPPQPDPATKLYFDPESYREPDECHLSQVEVIKGTIARGASSNVHDAGADAGLDFIGEDIIEIRTLSGADCAKLLASAGGPFVALPCRATYTLEGELIE